MIFIKSIISLILILFVMQDNVIFKFEKQCDIKGWNIVDDNVMGGRSNGTFRLTADGFGVFEGDISLENNGGFSSVRYAFERMNVSASAKVTLRIKGDGKDYQFRIKSDRSEEYSYITTFKTSGNWEDVTINLADMYPSFRGSKLDMPNFNAVHIEEITFLIGNKKTEHFKLLIEKVELQ